MRARPVRMVLEHQGHYETQNAAVAAIAPKIGCIPETLMIWVRQAERDSGVRDGALVPSVTKSKNLSARFANCGKSMRFCVKRPHILRSSLSRFARKPLPGNGNSTARLNHDRVYSWPGRASQSDGPRGDDHRAAHGVWVDLQSFADCPIWLLRALGSAFRSGKSLSSPAD